MGIRETLNEKPAVGYSVVGIIALLVAFFVWQAANTSSVPEHAIEAYLFYDANTGELFEAGTDQIAPINAPSGGEGYRAFVFSCSDCSDEKSRFTGYVHKFTPEAKAIITEGKDLTDPEIGAAYEAGSLVKAVDSDEWVTEASKEGSDLLKAIYKKCGGGHKTHSCDVMAKKK